MKLILELGMVWDKLTNLISCIAMQAIILVELLMLDHMIQECGVLWEIVLKKWILLMKLLNVKNKLNVSKIKSRWLCTNLLVCIIRLVNRKKQLFIFKKILKEDLKKEI